MRAITVRDRAVGAVGLTLSDIPRPHAAGERRDRALLRGRVHPGELDWPGTWTDRAGRDHTPNVPGHELSGVVTELGFPPRVPVPVLGHTLEHPAVAWP